MPNLETGGLVAADEFYPFQQYNRLLTHFRQSDPASALTNAQAGMIASDDDDNRLYHKTDDSLVWDEILQEASSHEAEPIFKALKLQVGESNVSDPPTDSQLDSLFGTPSSLGNGWHCFVKDTGSGLSKVYLVVAYGSEWHTFTGTLAA
jgi:hypothetical protein